MYALSKSLPFCVLSEETVASTPFFSVVDASLFPTVPCANTNFPTLMTAEKIADAILAA